ncbi:acyltransferase family protein [Acinetobacter junii]|uniref:acyltransferase family protein n=1 Tax=Acinetobacter junii TaxID=40215 RepID=UPI003A843405
MNSNFRYDINGLRAYAVALVVLFHFGITGFSGGFIGVDIFFVISGFLMTQIIVSGLEKKSFSFVKFYISRANRIIPPLVVLSLIVGMIGWFTLTPQELKDYGKHASTSLSFISNIQYFRESGYFNTDSHEKLLLHTWSLSVEWQFYIILPIFLFIINYFTKRRIYLSFLFSVVLIASLFLSISITKTNPTAAFFLLPTRAWEMMTGGLIYLFLHRTKFNKPQSIFLEVSGFTLILLSVTFFSEKTPWPSYNALIPVIGTFLILISSNNNSIFTKNKVAQFLGNTSYSIYLWHWPIVFYLSYIEKSKDLIYIIIGIILSIFLGWLSFKFIETPARFFLSKCKIFKNYLITLIYLTFSIIIFIIFYVKDGIPNRLPQNINKIAKQTNNKNPLMQKCHIGQGKNVPECKYGNGKVRLIVLGDSHAAAMIRSTEKVLPESSSVLDWTYSGCPTVENIKKVNSPNFQCGVVISNFLEKVHLYPNTPILVINRLNVLFHGAPDGDNDLSKPIRYINTPMNSYNNEYYNTMRRAYVSTLCKFSKNNPVFVTRPTPEFPRNVPKTLAHKAIINSETRMSISKAEYMQRSKLAYEAQDEAVEKCGVKILETKDFFCDNYYCYPDKNGIPLYFDDDHLSVYGADQLIPLFRKIWN